MKTCKRCNIEQALSNFPRRRTEVDGLHIYCKQCINDMRAKYNSKNKKQRKEAKHKYYISNRDNILARMKETRPPGSRKEYLKKYYTKNKEKAKKVTQEWRNKNRDKLNQWCREYYKDPAKRIARNMYNRVRTALFAQLSKKSQKTKCLCGCSWEDLVLYLEYRFKDGMTWDNYGFGIGKWSIDHIKPVSAFDLTDPVQQEECFHYTNLQPLWSSENSSKRNKY